jgi:hypothetical protein
MPTAQFYLLDVTTMVATFTIPFSSFLALGVCEQEHSYWAVSSGLDCDYGNIDTRLAPRGS